MATVRDVCNGALRRIGVSESGEDAPGEDMAVAQAAFDGLHFEALADGWLTAFTASTLDDVVTASLVEPLKAAVAVRISPEFGRQVDAETRNLATRWRSMLANTYWTDDDNRHTLERGVWEPRSAESTLIDG